MCSRDRRLGIFSPATRVRSLPFMTVIADWYLALAFTNCERRRRSSGIAAGSIPLHIPEEPLLRSGKGIIALLGSPDRIFTRSQPTRILAVAQVLRLLSHRRRVALRII